MYYNHGYNYISPEQRMIIIRNNKIENIRKTLSGLGFALFTSQIVFTLLWKIGSILLTDNSLISVDFYFDNFLAVSEFWHGITLFISLFVVGSIYCLLSKTSLSDIFKFQKVGVSRIIGYTLLGLGIAYTGNILTSLLLGNMELIGIANESGSTVVENNLFNFIVSTFITAVTPAFAEEFLFRGVILGKLRKYGDGFAVLISSVLFALMHCNIGQIPFAFIGGAIFGFVTVKTNSILPAMIIHGANNLLSCIMNEIAMTNNDFISLFLPNLIFAVIFILGIIGFIILTKTDMLLFKFNNDFKDKSYNFSMKELMKYFFSNIGTIFALTILILETISRTQLLWIS